jgi:hypothetical protein
VSSLWPNESRLIRPRADSKRFGTASKPGLSYLRCRGSSPTPNSSIFWRRRRRCTSPPAHV